MILLLAVVYSAGLAIMGLYGARSLLHVALWARRHRATPRASTARANGTASRLSGATTDLATNIAHEWATAATVPIVTVQLPIYNEKGVAARAIAAACALHWPRERLEIQVLDDSTHATRAIIDAAVARGRAAGIDVRLLRRNNRDGFKGGALARGTAVAKGEFLAILDADFVPDPLWLKQMVPQLLAAPDVGCVQARWSHLNADHSALTRSQALALDGYFAIEQAARSAWRLSLNFNGSGGLWRAEAIASAGGWRGDTLCEDVDLSYRAQLAGWRIVYVNDVTVPGELPASMAAFKSQQARWARGTIQNLLRLGPRIIRSRWPLSRRMHALLCLSAHLVQPTLVALLLAAPALLLARPDLHPLLLVPTLFSLGQPGLIAAAQRDLYPRSWQRRMSDFPLLSVLAAGMTWNGAAAVARGLTGSTGTFERTAKQGDDARHARANSGSGAAMELLLAAYATSGLLLAVTMAAWGSVPFLTMFALGYWWVGSATLLEHRQSRAGGRPRVSPRTTGKQALELDR